MRAIEGRVFEKKLTPEFVGKGIISYVSVQRIPPGTLKSVPVLVAR